MDASTVLKTGRHTNCPYVNKKKLTGGSDRDVDPPGECAAAWVVQGAEHVRAPGVFGWYLVGIWVFEYLSVGVELLRLRR